MPQPASEQTVLERRRQLLATGYSCIPLYGKEPPIYGRNNKHKGLTGWQQIGNITDELLVMWDKTWPDAGNTGILTRAMPTLDLDILNEDAARALEDHVRERYEEHGYVLTRVGRAPKMAIPFRTIEPFAKFAVNLTAPNGSNEKIEFLADGAQVAAFGIHPDTQLPYRWHGGEPGEIKLEDLPYIRDEEAHQLVDDLAQILVDRFGYVRAKHRKGNGQNNDNTSAPDDWQFLLDNVLAGRALHDSLRDLAAKMIAAGMSGGAAVNSLRAVMNSSQAPRDDRFKDRYNEIPRLVESAQELIEEPPPAPAAPKVPLEIDNTLKVFEEWLLLKDTTPVLAVLGTVAANYLPGDPVWLALIAPPSSAKTEILNSTADLPQVVQAATVTPAGLLSGTPKKQQAAGAKGGLLRQIGDFGILALKDFGSILSMHPESKAELLAALREIYDGRWTRHLGTDGGRTLHWEGKLGLITASTGVIDAHYSVIGAMGDRFLFCRLAPTEGKAQFNRALVHVGAATKQMRAELTEAVARLFVGRKDEPQPISKDEIDLIGDAVALVVRLRGAVERDRRTSEIDAIYGAEGTARIGLTLERLLAGLDTLGVDRTRAMKVVLSVAMNSAPPLRRAAYEVVDKSETKTVKTADIATALGLPSNTARRILEDLAAYGLLTRQSQGQGNPDLWLRAQWDTQQ